MVTENCLYRKIISWYINCKVEKLQGCTLDLWEAASKWSLWPPCWRNQTRQRIPIVLLWFERMFPPRCRPEMGIRRLTCRQKYLLDYFLLTITLCHSLCLTHFPFYVTLKTELLNFSKNNIRKRPFQTYLLPLTTSPRAKPFLRKYVPFAWKKVSHKNDFGEDSVAQRQRTTRKWPVRAKLFTWQCSNPNETYFVLLSVFKKLKSEIKISSPFQFHSVTLVSREHSVSCEYTYCSVKPCWTLLSSCQTS